MNKTQANVWFRCRPQHKLKNPQGNRTNFLVFSPSHTKDVNSLLIRQEKMKFRAQAAVQYMPHLDILKREHDETQSEFSIYFACVNIYLPTRAGQADLSVAGTSELASRRALAASYNLFSPLCSCRALRALLCSKTWTHAIVSHYPPP